MADEQPAQASAPQADEDKRPLNEQYVARLKNYRLVAILMALAAIVTGVASFTDAAGKLLAPFHRQRPDDARQELARLAVSFTADDFSAAAGKGDLIVTRLFLVAGMRPDEAPGMPLHPTALVAAVQGNRPEVVAALLKAGADPTLHVNVFHSAVEVAAVHGDVGIETTLLAAKPAPQKELDSAFVLAAESAQPQMLQFLQGRGANAAGLATQALDQAASASRVDGKAMAEVVDFLLQAGADIEFRSGDSDWTPLLAASFHSQPLVVQALLDHGAAVDARDRDGRTALWWAAGAGGVEQARLLLAKGADPNAKDKEGTTPLGRARYNLDEAMAQLLREHGAR